MKKFLVLLVVFVVLTVGLYLYVRNLEKKNVVTDTLVVQPPVVEKMKDETSVKTDNPYFDLIIVNGKLLEVVKTGDSGQMKVEVNKDNKNVVVNFDLGNLNTKISTKQTTIKNNTNTNKEMFQAMSAYDAAYKVSTQQDKQIQVLLPVKIKKKPNICDSVCESVYAFIQKYLNKNNEFANSFDSDKSYTLGGIYEIAWTTYD